MADIVRQGRLQNPPFRLRGGQQLLVALMTASALMLAAPGAALASNNGTGKPGSAKTSSSGAHKEKTKVKAAASNGRSTARAGTTGRSSSAKEARGARSKKGAVEARTAVAAAAAKIGRAHV